MAVMPRRSLLLLLFLLRDTHEFAVPRGEIAVLRRGLCATHPLRLCAADDVDAAQSFMQSPRPTSGKEAFDGTTWSVLLRMNEGGSVIFTMQLLDDETCRFSDSDQYGTWECDRDWVVVEKPKALFGQTLFFSAKLAAPSKERPKWRLVEGVVQAANASDASVEAEPPSDEVAQVEVTQVGTFGANEFEEALLTTIGRFQTASEDSRLPDLEPDQGR
jgi:hypothetical protein